jgi:4-hydroxybenzoate polyprenyltransferase
VIHALRLAMGCLAAIALAMSAFRLTEHKPSLLVLAALFCIVGATRLQNDWRDRYHDIGKGKALACSRPRLFAGCVLGLWALCCVLIGVVALQSGMTALLLGAMGLIGLVYSEARRIPWAPILLCSITAASPAFLPATLDQGLNRTLPLFVAAALLIFGREILKDFEDKKIDENYKWTIPLAYGERTAKWLVGMSVSGACIVVATITPWAIAGTVIMAAGLVLLRRDVSPQRAANWVDVGAAFAVAALVW